MFIQFDKIFKLFFKFFNFLFVDFDFGNGADVNFFFWLLHWFLLLILYWSLFYTLFWSHLLNLFRFRRWWSQLHHSFLCLSKYFKGFLFHFVWNSEAFGNFKKHIIVISGLNIQCIQGLIARFHHILYFFL